MGFHVLLFSATQFHPAPSPLAGDVAVASVLDIAGSFPVPVPFSLGAFLPQGA